MRFDGPFSPDPFVYLRSRAFRRMGAASATPAPTPAPTPTPTPDAPLSSINTDGWSGEWDGAALSAMTTDGTSEFAPTDTVALTRQGFTSAGASTTIPETMRVIKRVRQAYPNQALATTATVALADYVYSTDSIVGVTNNSTEKSPKPIANWATTFRQQVGDTIGAGTNAPVEIVAFHRNGVACVKLIISDGTNTVNVTVASPSISTRSTDLNKVIAYILPSTSIASLNAGLITVNAEVYPRIGADNATYADSSVNKSASNGSVGREFTTRYFTKSATAVTYAYVASTGNDTSGVASTNAATAAASPCLTICGALAKVNTLNSRVDGCEIRVVDSVASGTGVTLVQNSTQVTVTRAPTSTRSAAILALSTAFRPRLTAAASLTSPLTTAAIRFTDMTINRSVNVAITGEATAFLDVVFDDVDFTNSVTGALISSANLWVNGCTVTNSFATWSGLAGATALKPLYRGLSYDPNGGGVDNWLVLGSNITRPSAMSQASGTTESGTIVAFNQIRRSTANTMWGVAATASQTNIAIVQNLFEYTLGGSGHQLAVSNDNVLGGTTHLLMWHNTFTGAWQAGRNNLFYDEGTTPRTTKLHSVIGNIFTAYYIKGDRFRGENEAGADASTRTGNFAPLHGVAHRGNVMRYRANDVLGTNEALFYPGINTLHGTSNVTPLDVAFTSNAAATYNGTSYTAGAGSGTYTLGSGSVAIGLLPEEVLSHDLAGNARDRLSAGAYR